MGHGEVGGAVCAGPVTLSRGGLPAGRGAGRGGRLLRLARCEVSNDSRAARPYGGDVRGQSRAGGQAMEGAGEDCRGRGDRVVPVRGWRTGRNRTGCHRIQVGDSVAGGGHCPLDLPAEGRGWGGAHGGDDGEGELQAMADGDERGAEGDRPDDAEALPRRRSRRRRKGEEERRERKGGKPATPDLAAVPPERDRRSRVIGGGARRIGNRSTPSRDGPARCRVSDGDVATLAGADCLDGIVEFNGRRGCDRAIGRGENFLPRKEFGAAERTGARRRGG